MNKKIDSSSKQMLPTNSSNNKEKEKRNSNEKNVKINNKEKERKSMYCKRKRKFEGENDEKKVVKKMKLNNPQVFIKNIFFIFLQFGLKHNHNGAFICPFPNKNAFFLRRRVEKFKFV